MKLIDREDRWRLKAALIVVILYVAGLIIAALARADEIMVMDHTKAVIHHTASQDVSAATIDQWHKERGWDGIGYHFVIRKDGTVEPGRPLDKIGAHAKGRNNYIGIALTGYDSFTIEQIKSLWAVIHQYGIKEIYPHHENCPGPGLQLNWGKL